MTFVPEVFNPHLHHPHKFLLDAACNITSFRIVSLPSLNLTLRLDVPSSGHTHIHPHERRTHDVRESAATLTAAPRLRAFIARAAAAPFPSRRRRTGVTTRGFVAAAAAKDSASNSKHETKPNNAMRAPPKDVEIDKGIFSVRRIVRAVRVRKSKTDAVLKALRGYALDLPKVKAVRADVEDDGMNLVLLGDKIKESETLEGNVPEEKLEKIRASVGEGGIEMTTYELPLTYEYFNASQVLRRLLPDCVEVPSSFETVGHVAHMNLREEHEEHKYLIGKVILEKNERLKTVVNKVGSIESEFRVPEWELLAGDPSLVTEVKQHGMTFKLDFGSVYWNSRLETEHKRLVDSFNANDIICDATSGVGPFSIPAAARGIRCYASDLNPDCAKYLKMNAKENRVKNMVRCYNMDAREFIRTLLARPKDYSVDREKEWAQTKADFETKSAEYEAKKKDAKAKKAPFRDPKPKLKWAEDDDDGVPPAGSTFDRLITNLPASGIEFLDCLKGSFDRKTWEGRDLPMIHCYTFKGASETTEDVIKRGEGHLGGVIVDGTVSDVRDVSPNKLMVLLSFRITPDVAFSDKRQCIE